MPSLVIGALLDETQRQPRPYRLLYSLTKKMRYQERGICFYQAPFPAPEVMQCTRRGRGEDGGEEEVAVGGTVRED